MFTIPFFEVFCMLGAKVFFGVGACGKKAKDDVRSDEVITCAYEQGGRVLLWMNELLAFDCGD